MLTEKRLEACVLKALHERPVEIPVIAFQAESGFQAVFCVIDTRVQNPAVSSRGMFAGLFFFFEDNDIPVSLS
jgi:hypothetical protein